MFSPVRQLSWITSLRNTIHLRLTSVARSQYESLEHIPFIHLAFQTVVASLLWWAAGDTQS